MFENAKKQIHKFIKSKVVKLLLIIFCNIIIGEKCLGFLSEIKEGIELAKDANGMLGGSGLDSLLDIVEEGEDITEEIEGNDEASQQHADSQLREISKFMHDTHATQYEMDSILKDLDLHGKSISQSLRSVKRVIRSAKKVREFLNRFKEDKKQTALQKSIVEIEKEQLRSQIETSIFIQNKELREKNEKIKFKKDMFEDIKISLNEKIKNQQNFNAMVAQSSAQFLNFNLNQTVYYLALFGLAVALILIFTGIFYEVGFLILKGSVGFLLAAMILPELIKLFQKL